MGLYQLLPRLPATIKCGKPSQIGFPRKRDAPAARPQQGPAKVGISAGVTGNQPNNSLGSSSLATGVPLGHSPVGKRGREAANRSLPNESAVDRLRACPLATPVLRPCAVAVMKKQIA